MAHSPFPEHIDIIAGPSFQLSLAAEDARHPVHYSRRLLIFRCLTSEQRNTQLAALKIGLRSLLSRCSILGGIIIPSHIANDDWCTIEPDRGIELVVKDLRISLSSFEELERANFPSSQLPYDLLVPVPQDVGLDRRYPAYKMQFSAIEGGTILAFAMSHSVADGSGTNEILRVLSEETRLAQEISGKGAADEASSVDLPTEMGLDRSVLRNMTSPMAFNIERHPAYRAKTPEASTNTLSIPAPILPPQAASPDPTIPVILHIPPASLVKLKADASNPGAPPISTHDALAALTWQMLVRIQCSRSAQTLPTTTKSTIFLPSDARRHLKLPPSYVGNAVYQLTASLPLSTLLSPSGLQHAASALRHSITAVTPDLVASYMAKLKEEWVEWGFLGMDPVTDVAMGTDWSSGQVYDEDWGEAFGKVVRFRYPGEPGVAILPKLPDGGAEVLVSVLPTEERELRGVEGFGRYMQVL